MTILLYLIFFILLKYFKCIIVFPFKLATNSILSSDSKYYDSHYFLRENFDTLIYTTIQIGSPPQEIKTLISYNDCNFKIGKASKCIYTSQYLSFFNRNLSKTFNFTDYYPKPVAEFAGFKGHSAEDTISAYTDINLKNLEVFERIGFYLGSDTNEALCGIIGLRMQNYATFCLESNTIFQSFKSKDIIPNNKWMLNYTSKNEGLFIIGGEISELIPNFKEDKLYKTYSAMGGSSFPWTLVIWKIECGINNITINYEDVKAEINNDYSLIVGGFKYYSYIENNFFNDYVKLNICTIDLANYVENFKYHVIVCDKENFGEKDIEKFPILSFVMRGFGEKFIFEGKDLFIETRYKYFFNIVFSNSISERWILGKTFFQKYPTMIDLTGKIIEIYNNNNKEGKANDNEQESGTKPEDNSNNDNQKKEKNKGDGKLSTKFIVLMIVLIFGLICIFSALFYFIGKNINKLRKRKANELNDEYDYTSAERDDSINNNNVAENNNIKD